MQLVRDGVVMKTRTDDDGVFCFEAEHGLWSVAAEVDVTEYSVGV